MESPTILNNVETYANIAQIILHGAEWFRNLLEQSVKKVQIILRWVVKSNIPVWLRYQWELLYERL